MTVEQSTKSGTSTAWYSRVWQDLTKPHHSIEEVGEERSARLAISLILILAILIFFAFITGAQRTGYANSFSSLGSSLIAMPIAYLLAKTKQYRIGVFLFSVAFSGSAFLDIIRQGNTANISSIIFSFIPLSLIIASTFLSSWAVFLLIGLNVGSFLSMQYFGIVLPANFGGVAGVITTIGIVLILLTNYRNRTETLRLDEIRKINQELKDLSGNLEQRVNTRTSELLIANQQAEKRASQLQIVADVARTATSIQELSQLFNPLTHLISQRFGYYHVGIFLLDEQTQYAILEASNTEGGLVMLRRGHRLKVGEQGIVGFVTARGEPRIALDVGQDAVFFGNPDLPNTRSELALPLKIGEKIIGALDLQSTEESAFREEDISVLTILADQVAIAIQNARSVENAKRALLEAESATKQLSGEVWKEYTDNIRARGYRYDGVKPEPLHGSEKPSEEKDALLTPVQIRGQIIGRLKLKASDATRKWTDDERAIIESTAERVALAMESARLLEEAQKRARRESFLSEIGAKLGTSFQLDSILRDTVEELGQTLKGSTISFQLVNPSAPPTPDLPKSENASMRRKKAE
jgi:GAF domain-containing protein